ncbi:MAG: hypothetical protein M3083_21585 [Actinomycetota bacterium]|nr:hypothetical protein [Actinomycetota bacterium]
MEIEALPAWARERGVRIRRWLDGTRTEFVVQPHDLGTARLPGGEIMRIEQDAITTPGPREYRIHQPVTLSVEESGNSTWSGLLNRWLQPIQVLLWIATAEAGRTERLDLLVPQEGPVGSTWAKLWVPLVEPPRRTSRELTSHDVLLFADEMPGGFGPGMARWFNLWLELRHVLGPLYARASAPFGYANDRFYTAVAAIEAYHRYCVESDGDLPRQEHSERVDRLDRILAEHAPDLREWATNAARPFNRIPLWRRITQIAAVLERMTGGMFGDRVDEFAQAVEAARHGHAHALSRRGSIQDGPDLYVAADALVWLLRACVMIDLGLSVEEAEERVIQHERFAWMTHQLASLLAWLDQ